MHEKFQSCIDACNTCATSCEHCAGSCICLEETKSEVVACIRLDLDCAAICRLAAGIMSRGGPMAAQVCRLCATACDACAVECERHDMEHCRACAEACRAAARECRAMAG
jgi:hypothetical protein